MPLAINCPACNAGLTLDKALAGKKIRCPHRRGVMAVPVMAVPTGRLPGEERIQDPAPQLKARPSDGRRGPTPAEPLIAPPPRGNASFPVGYVVAGIVAGVGAIIVAIIVAFFLVLPEPPRPAAGPFVQMQGPGVNVKIEMPEGFPQVVMPPPPQPTAKANPAEANPVENSPPPPAKPAPQPEKVETEDPDPISRALKKARTDTFFGQSEAAKELNRMEPDDKRRPEVVAALKRIASTPGGLAARADAVRALVRWGTKDEAPFFLTLIDHPDRLVRQAVIAGLGQWKEGADPIAQRLVNGDDRPWASQALKDIGPAAEKSVIELLRHPNAEVRLESCRVLRVIGGKAAHAALVEAAEDPDENVVQAAREALPAALRPPIYGPNQFMKLNVHVRNPKSWPEIEARLRKLADAPKAVVKVNTSGDYKWVDLAPVNAEAEAFARRITFGKIVAVHGKQRLIYLDSGK